MLRSFLLIFPSDFSLPSEISTNVLSSGEPWASQVELVVKNLLASAGDIERCGFDPWVGKIPQRRKWQLIPVFFPGESYGQRSLAGYCPQAYKESDMTETT